MAYPVFSESSACPKCGYGAAVTRYCAGTATDEHLPGCTVPANVGDHLHRWCSRCQYERIELPLDAVPSGGEPA